MVAINTTAEPAARAARRARCVLETAAGALPGRIARAARRRGRRLVRAALRGVMPRSGGGGACTDDICSPHWRSIATLALGGVRVGGDEGGGGARAINWYVFNEPGGAVRQGGRRLQQAGRRQVPDQLRQAADRRQPAARADRPPPRRRGLGHRPDRHGRDLDRRVRRGGLDPAVGGRSAAPPRPRASSRARSRPWSTRARSGRSRSPATRSCSGTARTRSTSRRRTSPGTR